MVHEGTGETSRYEQFMEALTSVTDYLYSCPNVSTRYRLAQLDTSTPNHMRGPGEASGLPSIDGGAKAPPYILFRYVGRTFRSGVQAHAHQR